MKHFIITLAATAALIAGCGLDNDGLDIGPAPAGMEGLWEQAATGDTGALKQVELVRQGLWSTGGGSGCALNANIVTGTARVFSDVSANRLSNGYQCWQISGGWEALNSLCLSFWANGKRMCAGVGDKPILVADIKAAAGTRKWLHLDTLNNNGDAAGSRNLCTVPGGYVSGSFNVGYDVRFLNHFNSLFFTDWNDFNYACPDANH